MAEQHNIQFGVDGEPEPVGNERQRQVAEEIAATIKPPNKDGETTETPPQAAAIKEQIQNLEQKLETVKSEQPAAAPKPAPAPKTAAPAAAKP